MPERLSATLLPIFSSPARKAGSCAWAASESLAPSASVRRPSILSRVPSSTASSPAWTVALPGSQAEPPLPPLPKRRLPPYTSVSPK